MADKSIGERLKEARSRTGLTQSQVCEEVGIPKVQTLSAYELGKNSPPIDTTFKQLVTLYGVTADWVLFGEECPSNVEKSTHDYLAQLVEAVDRLGLKIYAYDKDGDPHVEIEMWSSKYVEIDTFSNVWCKYRGLADDGTLDGVDYELLIKKKIPNQFHKKDEQPDHCETAIENGELPF